MQKENPFDGETLINYLNKKFAKKYVAFRGKKIFFDERFKEDLIQESASTLLCEQEKFDINRGSFATWATPIIFNTVATYQLHFQTQVYVPPVRKQISKKVNELRSNVTTMNINDEYESGDEVTVSALNERIIQEYKSQQFIFEQMVDISYHLERIDVGSSHKKIINFMLDDFDMVEIGEMLECSKQAVHQKKNLALRHLKASLM